jgi:hypothetical protein
MPEIETRLPLPCCFDPVWSMAKPCRMTAFRKLRRCLGWLKWGASPTAFFGPQLKSYRLLMAYQTTSLFRDRQSEGAAPVAFRNCAEKWKAEL